MKSETGKSTIKFGKEARGKIASAYVVRSKKFNQGIEHAKKVRRIVMQDNISTDDLIEMLENALKAATADPVWLDFLILVTNETTHVQTTLSGTNSTD
jgi:hypothetical protein